MVNGQTIEVMMTPEWARYFQGLTGQVNDSAANIFNITSNGAVGLIQEDGGESVEFISVPSGPAIPANLIPFGDGTSTPVTDADFLFDPTANSGNGELTANSVTNNLTSSGFLLHGANATVSDPSASGVYISGGSADVAMGAGGEAQVFGGDGRVTGGGFLLAGGNAITGHGGTGGSLELYGGTGDGAGANGNLTILTAEGTGIQAIGSAFSILTPLGAQVSVIDDAGTSKIGVFTAVGTEVAQPAAATALHTALSDLGWRAAGPPNDFALDYTNTATVGNVTINKASGQVIMAAAATTLTLTNSRIAATSRVQLTFAANPGITTTLYAVAAAGSCTVNATAALTNQSKINFMVVN